LNSADPNALLSVLVATCDRPRRLERMLASLESEWPHLSEVVVVDNGCLDETAELLARLARERPGLVAVRYEPRGKSAALNFGMRFVRGRRVAFIDDDVVVRPGWARAYVDAFRASAHPGFQGRVLPPRDVREDPEQLRRWRLFGTLPLIDLGEEPCERRALTGANMALRREVLERVDGFDPRLGPGAAGLSEDTDLSQRVRALFGPFRYVPAAAVEHEHDEARLNERYFEEYNRRLGRSRLVQKQNSLFGSILPNLATAALMTWATRLRPPGRAHYRQRGKLYLYSEMLRCRARRGAGCPGAGAAGGERRLQRTTT